MEELLGTEFINDIGFHPHQTHAGLWKEFLSKWFLFHGSLLKPRALYMLSTCFTIELDPQTSERLLDLTVTGKPDATGTTGRPHGHAMWGQIMLEKVPFSGGCCLHHKRLCGLALMEELSDYQMSMESSWIEIKVK